ncbi:MAG: uracil-DNA glycosylase [Rhodobacteraceae bacterium]|nr:uracil-DNA glycosylase [Paracoccaceae bacterium]
MLFGDNALSAPEILPGEIEALLEFYTASGVDCFLEEEAIDRFALSEQQASQAAMRRSQGAPGNVPYERSQQLDGPRSSERSLSQPNGAPLNPSTTAKTAPVLGSSLVIPDQEAVESARVLASSATSLSDLRSRLEAFSGCNLKLSAKNLVFADGNPNARVMLIGEAPGREEDLKGLPFVGPDGRLLERMLQFIGLDRSSAYLTTFVPWRPPGNRTPTPQEREICKPFILRQIELVEPDVIVLLGGAVAKSLLGAQESIRKLRGGWMTLEIGGRSIQCMATYQPEFLLSNPIEKRLVWQDFLSIEEKMPA